jgi:hypothetical protein
MPASIAKNAQEGTRSEYLAQYALSSFGTAIPVPHPEDSSIDLYCTLGRRIGRRFLVENQYLVQVKSTNDPIRYSGKDEVKWLLSHKYPFLICVVSKKSARIEIYQTLALSTLSPKEDVDNIRLHPQSCPSGEYFPQVIDQESVDIYLGDPVVKFSVTNFSDKDFIAEITNTLRSWVELDQENIDLKSTGYTMFRIPVKWETNKPVQALKFIGNFKDCFANDKTKNRFNELFLKFLSHLVNQAAAERNQTMYDALLAFIDTHLSQHKLTDSFGIRILQFCVNSGNKHMGKPIKMLLHRENKA